VSKRRPPAVTKRELVHQVMPVTRRKQAREIYLQGNARVVGVPDFPKRRPWALGRSDREYRLDAVARLLSVSIKTVHNLLALHREHFQPRHRRARSSEAAPDIDGHKRKSDHLGRPEGPNARNARQALMSAALRQFPSSPLQPPVRFRSLARNVLCNRPRAQHCRRLGVGAHGVAGRTTGRLGCDRARGALCDDEAALLHTMPLSEFAEAAHQTCRLSGRCSYIPRQR
jgi:hypothetical protein